MIDLNTMKDKISKRLIFYLFLLFIVKIKKCCKERIKSSFSFSRKEKEKTTFKQSKIYFYLESLRPMFLITVPAVDWSVTIWFERNLGFLAAICTGYIMHFTRCAIIPTTTIGSISFFHYYILPFFYIIGSLFP